MNSQGERQPTVASAILFAAWPGQAVATSAQQPGILAPVLGKPLLQRALERLVEHGLAEVRIVVGDNAAAVRGLLGDGEAWGCQLSYHYLPPLEQLARGLGQFMRSLDVRPDHRYWLADGGRVPGMALADSCLPAGVVQLHWPCHRRLEWSGWACLPGSWLLAPERPFTRNALADALRTDGDICSHLVAAPLAGDDAADLLDASRRLLGDAAAGRIHPSCRIHPSARVLMPAWIGPDVHIGAGAVVGPRAAVGAGVFIDRDTVLVDALVLPDTYLGAQLDVRVAVIAGADLHSVAHGCVTTVGDAGLLADLARARPAARRLEPALALVLVLALWPLGMLASRRRGHFSTHFAEQFLPGLRLVCRGRMRLAGAPRSQPAGLPGLLDEAALLPPHECDSTMRYASAIMASARQDDAGFVLQLLGRYLKRVLQDLMFPSAWRRHWSPTDKPT